MTLSGLSFLPKVRLSSPCPSRIIFILLIVSLNFLSDSQAGSDVSIANPSSLAKPETPLLITFNNTLSNNNNNDVKVKRKRRKKGSQKRWARIRPRSGGSGVGNWIWKLFTTESAIQHLQKLKDKLLLSYAKKSEEIGSSRDGIGFPSLEGALLSLAFLTFAVFLIDLVQTLLSRLRGGVVVNRPLIAGRRKRSPDAQAAVSTMSSLTSLVVSSIERPFFDYLKTG